MESTPIINNDEFNRLDDLGQLPGLNIYTQICLCYKLPDSASQSSIIHTLQTGLEKLATSFPWLAAKVGDDGASPGSTGTFRFKPYEKTPRLVVKDYTNDASIPSMNEMVAANFPVTMLDESILAPIPTIPALAPDHEEAKQKPVFGVQANFIRGGLLLTVVAQHQTMDGIGLGQVLSLFSKACLGDNFTEEELISGNLTRDNRIPLLNPSSWEPGPELVHQITPSIQTPPTPESPPSKCTWSNFSFSPTSLSTIKSLAMKDLPAGEFISTDDALTAFIFRTLRPSPSAILCRAVDVRHLFSLPKTYCGMFQSMTYHNHTSPDQTLSALALSLRRAISLSTSTLEYDTRSLATYIHHTPDRSSISLTANLDLSRDVMISSWVKMDGVYELEFGLGVGKPVAVRRPRFEPVEGLAYLLPRDGEEGEVVLVTCLKEEELERLKGREEWNRFATFIG